jgi:uncharacterized repeat protein (TIGR01451 family)
MNTIVRRSLACTVAVLVLCALLDTAHAQRHRATRLGDPAHRFADPLTTVGQLRALFIDPALDADVAAILQQAGWKGDAADLRRAAMTAPVSEWQIPTGTRMPFMSSRNGGKPVALIDGLWAGKKPVDAYAFEFASRGQRYRCITPKPCSNFFVEPIGPEPPPISLHFEVVDLDDPVMVGERVTYEIKVVNQGQQPITNIRLECALPPNQGFVSGEGATPVPEREQIVRMTALPSLAGKEVATWRVVVKALREGDTRFRVDLSCDQLKTPVTRTEATQQH